MIELLYEDRFLAVAVKPVGTLSEKSPDGEDILSLLEAQLGGDVGSVHRLDRTTGGIMLFSREPGITHRLSEALHERRVVKEYLAVLEGSPATPDGVLEDLLFRDAARGKVYVVARARKGAKPASLSYRTLETVQTERGPRTLVRVTLHTGRTHQIRVQFAHRGTPLCGDGKYGGRDNKSAVASLWSAHLTLTHPVTGREIDAVSLPPAERYPWSLFDLSQARTEFGRGDHA